MGLEQDYHTILTHCKCHAEQHGWSTHRTGAHLGYFKWKQEPWWSEMSSFIQTLDLESYDPSTWDWVDQCDIGIDYFNQYLMKHRPSRPIFKKYIFLRLSNERILP